MIQLSVIGRKLIEIGLKFITLGVLFMDKEIKKEKIERQKKSQGKNKKNVLFLYPTPAPGSRYLSGNHDQNHLERFFRF